MTRNTQLTTFVLIFGTNPPKQEAILLLIYAAGVYYIAVHTKRKKKTAIKKPDIAKWQAKAVRLLTNF